MDGAVEPVVAGLDVVGELNLEGVPALTLEGDHAAVVVRRVAVEGRLTLVGFGTRLVRILRGRAAVDVAGLTGVLRDERAFVVLVDRPRDAEVLEELVRSGADLLVEH